MTESREGANKRKGSEILEDVDAVSDSTNDTAILNPFERRIKRLKLLANEFETKLVQAPEIKQIEDLFKSVVISLERPDDDLDGLIHLYRVQRTTIKALVRPIIRKLTLHQAKIALRRLLDNKFMSGTTFRLVVSNHRQIWVKEILRVFSQDILSAEFKQELKQLEDFAYQTLSNQNAMGRLYGRLTTVLDQQFRQKLKQGKDLDELVRSNGNLLHYRLPSSSWTQTTSASPEGQVEEDGNTSNSCRNNNSTEESSAHSLENSSSSVSSCESHNDIEIDDIEDS